ncbi:MAG: hypothetical protein ABI384_02805, partial [Allobranchiibius sp.]
IAASDARRWKELNPLNPQKVMPDDGGWYPIQVGERIYLPGGWDLDALRAKEFDVYPRPGDPPPAPPPDGGPRELSAPPAIVDCSDHHVTAPFADAPLRRAVERHVEAVFFEEDAVPDHVCDGGPCTTATCELYDPRAFTLDFVLLDGRYERVDLALIDESGAPMGRRDYCLLADGAPVYGTTDDRGRTRTVPATSVTSPGSECRPTCSAGTCGWRGTTC